VAAPAPAQPAPQSAPNNNGRGNYGRRGFGGNNNNAVAAPAAAPQAAAPAAAPNNGGRGNFGHRDYRPDFNRGNNRPGFNGRPGGPRPSWNSYHRAFNAPHRYRAPHPYRRPPGYYYRRWTYGQFLPSIFWARDYWMDDWMDFGLMSPPPGTVWVRYGDDALLIDEYTGEVIQVEYDIFY
jgi:Ni/Co efflux regulator RcnB